MSFWQCTVYSIGLGRAPASSDSEGSMRSWSSSHPFSIESSDELTPRKALSLSVEVVLFESLREFEYSICFSNEN